MGGVLLVAAAVAALLKAPFLLWAILVSLGAIKLSHQFIVFGLRKPSRSWSGRLARHPMAAALLALAGWLGYEVVALARTGSVWHVVGTAIAASGTAMAAYDLRKQLRSGA